VERSDDAERFADEVAAESSPWTDIQGLPRPDTFYDSAAPGSPAGRST